MSITTIRHQECDLTEHIVTGVVRDEEMFECEAEFYLNSPTRLQLWEMSAAKLTQVTTKGLQQFVSRAAQLGKVRPRGRTAVIVRTKLQYGFGRMAEAFGQIKSLPFAFGIFYKRADALAWLAEEEDSSGQLEDASDDRIELRLSAKPK